MKRVTHTFIEKRVDDCIAVGSKEDGFASFSPIPFPSLQNGSNTLVQLLLLTTILLFHPLCTNQVIPLHSPISICHNLHIHISSPEREVGYALSIPYLIFPFTNSQSSLTIPVPFPPIHSLLPKRSECAKSVEFP